MCLNAMCIVASLGLVTLLPVHSCTTFVIRFCMWGRVWNEPWMGRMMFMCVHRAVGKDERDGEVRLAAFLK